jgi:hypothetical protein
MLSRSRTICLAALTATLAFAAVGCGGSDGSSTTEASGSPGSTASTPSAFRPAGVAKGVEEEIDVHDARCRPRPGGDGRHFRCHVRSGRERFVLSVEVLEAEGSPVITDCEFATRRERPLEMSTCAFPGKGGEAP